MYICLCMKVLIVEDNVQLSENITTYLSKEGYICTPAFTYYEALDRLLSFSYDIIVLDIMLPDGDGLNVLNELKTQKNNTGVIISSAKNSLDDKLRGLDLGADDYITKPYHLPELNARIKAIYRRRNFEGNRLITFNEISINPDTMEVTVKETPIILTRKEYELLVYFIANRNRVLTKQSIAEHLWGDHMDLADSFDFVYQHIKNLRKKITQVGGNDYISTIYGLGYRMT